MADTFKTLKVTQAVPGGPFQEQLVGAVNTSTGAPDAGKVVLLNSAGQIDPSMGGGGGGSSFPALTGGVNNSGQVFVVGSSSSFSYSGTGTINASEINGVPFTNTNPSLGKIPIAQGDGTATWADPFVQGVYAPGTNVITGGISLGPINPVLIGAQNPTNLLENIHVDSSGNLLVVASGTVAVTQSTSPWVVSLTSTTITGTVATQDAADGTPGTTAPILAIQVAGADYSTGFLHSLSTDSTGRLNVNTTGGFTPALTADRIASGLITSTQTVLISTQGGGAVTFQVEGAWTGTLFFEGSTDAANWFPVVGYPIGGGTTVSSITVPPTAATGLWVSGCGGLNEFRVRGSVLTGTATISLEVGAGSNGIQAEVTGQVSISNFPGSQTISGTVIANQGTQGTIGQSFYTAITDLTNVLGTTTHPLVVNVNNTPSVSVSNTITANIQSGGTTLTNTGGSLNVNITGGSGTTTQYADGTTQATPQGTVALGKNPSNVLHSLALDASGNLNVNVNTTGTTKVSDGTNVVFTTAHPGVTEDISDGTPGATAPATALQVAGKDYATGFLHPFSTDSSGVMNVNAAVSGSFTPALTSDRTSNGTLTTINTAITISTQGVSGVLFNIVNDTTTWTGTLVFEASVDGVNWVPVTCFAKYPSGVGASSTTTNGQWAFPAGGLNSFRVRASTTITGGTGAKIWIEAGAGALIVESVQNTAANLNATVTGSVTSNQGTQGVVTSPWFVAITDDSTSNIYGVSTLHPLQISGPVSFSSVISASNSSTALLGSNAVFTGTSASTLGYTALLVNSFSDKSSATNGLQIEQSQDGTNWDVIDSFTTSGNTPFQTTIYVVSAFVRVVYTNGTLSQASFRLQLVLQTAGDVTSRTLSTLGHTQVAIAEPLPPSTNTIGNVAYPLPTTSRMANTPITFSSTGDNTVIAGVGGQTIRIWRILFVVGGTTNLTFKDGASSAQTGAMPFAAQGALVLDFSGEPWYITSSGNAWIINQSGSAQISGTVWYTQS